MNNAPGDGPAHELHDSTPGLYVLAHGWTAGVLRNSYRRTSVYAGKVWRAGPLDFTVGAITGYQYRHVSGRSACPYDQQGDEYSHLHARCWSEVGTTRAVLRPLVAASYAVPLPTLQPRLTLLRKGLHLSIERAL